MRYIKLLISVLAVLAAFWTPAYAEEKQEPALAATSDTKQQEGASQGSADSAAIKEKRYVAAIGPDGAQHVDVIGGEYYFDPNHIVVKVNVPVVLDVKKEKGFVPHDVVVKAPDAGIDFKIDLSDEGAKTVKFTPTKPGKYEMICDKKLLFFKSHKDRGMHGIIEVVE